MNKQGSLVNGKVVGGIEWTKTVLPDGTERQGYTSNPIGGCFHACQWTMPDGTIANCYAEDVADRVAQKAYPQGFEHHYWKPSEFDQWKKLPAGSKVFVGSMADVFGHWVPEGQIVEVLRHAALYPAVTFQFLTKNPRRVRLFTDLIPRNCWIGASTPPDFMWNKPLDAHQRGQMLIKTMETFEALKAEGVTTWLSAEPLTINAGWYIESWTVIDWIVIGAASNGAKEYAPHELLVSDTVGICDRHGIPVFYKGNLRSLQWAANDWREDFPQAVTP